MCLVGVFVIFQIKVLHCNNAICVLSIYIYIRFGDIAPEKNIYVDNQHDSCMGDSSTELGNILPNLLAVLHHLS